MLTKSKSRLDSVGDSCSELLHSRIFWDASVRKKTVRATGNLHIPAIGNDVGELIGMGYDDRRIYY